MWVSQRDDQPRESESKKMLEIVLQARFRPFCCRNDRDNDKAQNDQPGCNLEHFHDEISDHLAYKAYNVPLQGAGKWQESYHPSIRVQQLNSSMMNDAAGADGARSHS
jgi:hypothetical protein